MLENTDSDSLELLPKKSAAAEEKRSVETTVSGRNPAPRAVPKIQLPTAREKVVPAMNVSAIRVEDESPSPQTASKAVELPRQGDELRVGEKIGQYVIEEKLSPKGNFLRFKIFHTRLKVSRELYLLDPAVVRSNVKLVVRIRERVSSFRGVSHPNLRNILYVVDEPERDFFGIILEAVRAESLAQSKYFGCMPQEMASKVILAVATALSHFELLGHWHGNVGKDNIMISGDGNDVKLDGFMDVCRADLGARNFGGFRGIQGDLSCAGALFYTMLTGKEPPENRQDAASCDPRTQVPGISGDISLLVIRLLTGNRMTRYASAAEFLLAAQALNPEYGKKEKKDSFRQMFNAGFSVWKVAALIIGICLGVALNRYISKSEIAPVKTPEAYKKAQQTYKIELKQHEAVMQSLEDMRQVWRRETERMTKWKRGKKHE